MPMILAAARINAKLSKTQVCEALKIHPNTLDSYESYTTKPNIDRAIQMAELYGCSIDEIKWSDEE